jgi:hypothetical protein
MRRTTLFLILVACTAPIALSACGGDEPPTPSTVTRETTIIREPTPSLSPAEVIVRQAPPPPREELRGAPPSPVAAWIPGSWSWNNGWVWTPGRWEMPPQRATAWVPGQWEPRGQDWVWRPGHWQ